MANKKNLKIYLRLTSTLIIIAIFISVVIYAINFYSQKNTITHTLELREAAFESGQASSMIKDKVKIDLSNLLSSECSE